jgi:DNA modification methylase
VECVIVDLSPDDEKELLIRLNANTGDWDTDLLLQDWDADKLADWGVEMPEFESETTLEAQEDDYEIPDQIQTDIVLGDLFEIGEHRLLCGDSTDINAVGKLMKGEKIDTVITSPPYNQGGGKGDLFSHGKRNESLYQNDFDNKTKDEYFDFIISILNTILLFLNETHTIVWNVSYNAKSRDDYGKIIFSDKNPFTVKETIIWNKGGSINLPQEGIYSRKCELVFIMSNYDKYNSSQKYGDCRWNYWETTKVNQLSNHKATFPIEFAENAVNEFSIEKNLIFEPFCGSGTTMVASHQLKRKCYGMELDPKYCQVIVDRMKKLDTTLVIKKNGVVI